MRRELAAAGIRQPRLVRAYSVCRSLNAQYGKTYFLATQLLPPAKRPFVHALYGFARYADEIVDARGGWTTAKRESALAKLAESLDAGLAAGGSPEPVIDAVVDTALRWHIPTEHFAAFLHSMQMDLTVSSYDTFADLGEYVHGSAAVIGLQMLPILEPTDPRACAVGAEQLGIAFQLANFIRDIGEDLDRGRIYLPLSELAAHGVTPDALKRRVVDDNLRSALAEQIARVRDLSARAAPTIDLLHPSVRDTIEAARVLYCGIADEVEANDYQVFTTRAKVGLRRRGSVAAKHLIAARRARRIYGPGIIPDPRPLIGATAAAR